MKYTVPILIFLLFFSCKKEKIEAPGIKYTGYYIHVEGGSLDIKVDSISTIEELIPRLITNNELYETGKRYWFGYNDLMFSIAVHSDSAIKPLLTFIDTTKSYDAKIAACYTLHLIGINCIEKGRISEEFVNTKARKALLGLLRDDKLQKFVMELLIRDAWQSDVPTLMDILHASKSDCWPITNGLVRYMLSDCPINQKIPQEIKDLHIQFTPLQLPNNKPDNKRYKKLFGRFFVQFRKTYKSIIFIEDTLLDYDFYHPPFSTYGEPLSFLNLDQLLQSTYQNDYCDIGNNLQYYFVKDKIHICSSMTGKRRWLNWWGSRDQSFIDLLISSKKRTSNTEVIHNKPKPIMLPM